MDRKKFMLVPVPGPIAQALIKCNEKVTQLEDKMLELETMFDKPAEPYLLLGYGPETHSTQILHQRVRLVNMRLKSLLVKIKALMDDDGSSLKVLEIKPN